MAPVATLAVALALFFDLLVGEPPERLHPVAWFGSLVGRFDREFTHPGAVGLAVALALPLGAAFLAALPIALVLSVNALVAGLLAGVVLFTTVSLRMLLTVASTVVAASDGDPETAKKTVVSLVGRDTTSLSPAEIRSAAVESVAENLADGLVGPLLAFAVGAVIWLPLGVAGAVWVKAVNTLDSMLGYPDKPHGTASARLDDAVEWVPARLSAVLIALGALAPDAVREAGQWARIPNSPNSGWPMATLAAALQVRLHKQGAYDLRPEAPLPSIETATDGIRVVGRAGILAFAVAGVVAWW